MSGQPLVHISGGVYGTRTMNRRYTANAPQARVIRAVSRGARSIDDIASKADLSIDHARTCLTRLRTKGYVRAVPVRGGKKQWREYEPVGATCILAQVWT